MLSCFFNVINAQMKTPLTVPSPNVTSLGEFGKTPVSYFTGTPIINVPLYTIALEEKEFNITLDYLAKGVKPDQHPGWVGQNWSLNVGGQIIRTINGLPDEDYYSYYWTGREESVTAAGFYYNYNVCNNTLWDTNSYVKNLASNKDGYRKDNQPDEFFFNFGIISGSFYLGHDGKWVVKSNSNIRIQFNDFISIPKSEYYYYQNSSSNNQNNQTFSGFTLIDEQGFKYVFGGSLTNIDLSSTFNSRSLANTWHLSKIISPSGKIINFEYEKDNTVVSISRNMSFNYKTEVRQNLLFCVPTIPNYPKNICSIVSYYSRPSYLKKISTSKEILTFFRSTSQELRSLENYTDIDKDKYYDPNVNDPFKHLLKVVDPLATAPVLGSVLINKIQWKKLDSFTIASAMAPNKSLFSYDFSYSNNTSERLKLLSLQKRNNNSAVQKYDFDYYDNPSIELPDYGSVQLDHWGFYNAKQNNTDLLKWNTNDRVPMSFFENYSSERSSSLSIDVLQEGSLRRLYYPTGGYSEYIYEPHEYSKEVSTDHTVVTNNGLNKQAGGFRIKKIIDVAVGTPNMEREFKYINGYESGNTQSSGILNSQPKYYFQYAGLVNSTEYTSKVFSSKGLFPFSGNEAGLHIGYSSVVEKSSGNGYKIYTFSNYDNGYLDELISNNSDFPNREYTIYDPYNEKNIERGRLLEEKIYNESNTLLFKEINTYEALNNDFVRSIDASSIPSCDNITGYATYFAYRIYNYKYNLVKKETISYKNNNQLQVNQTTNYVFNSQNLVSEKKKKISNGDWLKKIYYYPADLLTGIEANEMQQLLDFYRISVPIKTQSFINNEKISEDLIKFTSDPVKTSGLLLPAAKYSLKGNGIIDFQKSNDIKISYEMYDNAGNVLQYTLNGGIPTSIIWGYKNEYPIAKIENIAYNSIPSNLIVAAQTASDTGNEVQLQNTLNNIRNATELSGAMVTTYTYIPLIGLSSIKDQKGALTYYEYDSFGRLMFVKDHDLNILQRYCYGYKGQQVDCSAADPYLITYKSIARSGSFTRNNCTSGQVGSSVTYSQLAGAATSTVSQADADAKGLTLFNTQGQANANATGTCTFNSIARSGSFTRNNCGTGAGSSVAYSQPAGAQTSIVSQADADAKGLALFNTNGQANANAAGICTFSSVAQSGSFERNNCASGGIGSSVVYNQAVGAVKSTLSQADADTRGLALFNTNGYAYARVTGVCTFSSTAQNGSFVKNNCPEGSEGSSVPYNQAAGAATSTVSQAAADEAGVAKFNIDGQTNANQAGTCTQFITYTPRWNPATKTLALLAVAANANHNGVTVRFNITYDNGGTNTQTAVIFIAAGKTSNAITVILPSQYTPTVILTAIERNL